MLRTPKRRRRSSRPRSRSSTACCRRSCCRCPQVRHTSLTFRPENPTYGPRTQRSFSPRRPPRWSRGRRMGRSRCNGPGRPASSLARRNPRVDRNSENGQRPWSATEIQFATDHGLRTTDQEREMMMDMSQARLTLTPPPSSPSPRGRGGRNAVLALAVLTCALAGGCTAVTNPNGDGIPVRLLPQEIVGPIKTNYQTVPLSMLRQPQPDVYRLAAGDVLGVFVDGFLGEKTVVTPGQMPPLIQLRDQNRFAPPAGYPIPVQEDGTIALPAVAKLSVKGKTVGEAQELVRDQYLKAGLIKKESDRNLVTLLYQRQEQELVFRQEATSFYVGADGPFPTSKRNTGQVVDLPAYQNDVLTALARSGGLPDADAHNEIIIYRDSFRGVPNKLDAMKQFDKAQAKNLRELGVMADETIRIPLRLPTGAPLPFGKEDVILKNGDVIFLEARDEEVFYTAGLL